jgi:hypothetical protein
MVRALVALAALCGGCTLLVEHELSSRASGGGCEERIFLNGSPNDAGLFFHSGVTKVAWHGPSFPPGADATYFGATLAFLADGGLEVAGGFREEVNFRDLSGVTPSAAFPVGGHENTNGFGCSEVLAADYDSLHDTTHWRVVPGGCADDSTFYDGGATTGSPEAQGAALGWAPQPAAGGTLAAMFGGRAQSCADSFPVSCVPPQGAFLPAAGTRKLDSLTSGGQIFWVVSIFPATGDGETRLYSGDFAGTAPGPVVPFGGSVALLAADVGLSARIVLPGKLRLQFFNATGQPGFGGGDLELNDVGAHSAEIARFGGGGTQVRAAWIGGDGQARTANIDASSPSAPVLSGVKVVCNSAGATFVAPMTQTITAVLVGEGLYLRPQ